jgi:hypothetical protein
VICRRRCEPPALPGTGSCAEDSYSREKLRILLSVDADETDMAQGVCNRNQWEHSRGCSRSDNDYAVEFVPGDLDADTTPSAKMAGQIQNDLRSETIVSVRSAGATLESQPSSELKVPRGVLHRAELSEIRRIDVCRRRREDYVVENVKHVG